MQSFQFFSPGRIVFGPNTLTKLGEYAKPLAKNFLIVSGATAMRKAGFLDQIEQTLTDCQLSYSHYNGISGEPEIATVNVGLNLARKNNCSAVIAIGGGSVIDTGKAIAGLIPNSGEMIDYLNPTGTSRVMTEAPVPMIAIPTTSGTGAEVTKNAVIRSTQHHFKQSFRDDRLVPNVAIVDPVLTTGLSPQTTATSGMDALTQLIEAYVSNKSGPLTDALALEGVRKAAKALPRAFNMGTDQTAREDMAFASLVSGLCLANAGLGAVHGIAAAIGAHTEVEHGLACAVLLPHIMECNLDAQLEKYATIGCALPGCPTDAGRSAALYSVAFVQDLLYRLEIQPNFRSYAIDADTITKIAADSNSGSSMKGNPIRISQDSIEQLLAKLCF